MSVGTGHGSGSPARGRILYDPKVRGLVYQAVVLIAIAAFVWWVFGNTAANLRRANIASGFGFFDARAGFDVSQSLIPFTNDSTYFRAFLVGLLNTLYVAFLGIVLCTVLGFAIGIARLSRNWLLARMATVYVEVLRNIPLLLQLLFLYKAVLIVLPPPRQGIELWFSGNLNNRGLFIPHPIFETGFGRTVAATAVALVAVAGLALWARRRRMATGRHFPTVWVSAAVLIGLPLAVFFASGAPMSFEVPVRKGFNLVGGLHIKPEFMALLAGLSLYTAAFVGEIVRAGIMAVPHGQTEAATALGLRRGATLRLVVIPQALRVIIPPLTSQYLNLTKNSSLAVAIGYPDLVAVFSGTVLNQTGQAVEVIFITMLVYLTLSLSTAGFMNWFNARMALVER